MLHCDWSKDWKAGGSPVLPKNIQFSRLIYKTVFLIPWDFYFNQIPAYFSVIYKVNLLDFSFFVEAYSTFTTAKVWGKIMSFFLGTNKAGCSLQSVFILLTSATARHCIVDKKAKYIGALNEQLTYYLRCVQLQQMSFDHNCRFQSIQCNIREITEFLFAVSICTRILKYRV